MASKKPPKRTKYGTPRRKRCPRTCLCLCHKPNQVNPHPWRECNWRRSHKSVD